MSSPDDLIRKHLDGLATDGERKELDRLLSESPAAAEAFARASRLDHALDRHFHEEQAITAIQGRIRGLGRRRRLRVASAAAAFLIATLAFYLTRGEKPPLFFLDGKPQHQLTFMGGQHSLRFPGESTRIDLSPDARFVISALTPAKRFTLSKGSLRAVVARQPEPMILTTPDAVARVLGTRFILSASGKSTRLEVTEGSVRLIGGDESVDVGASEAAETRPGAKILRSGVYDGRFAALWRDLHDPKKGYFSADGIPYHSVETLIVDAPDYGHLTTSETMSYWLWLEAMQGRLTGDWAPFNAAWKKMEEAFIPSPADQPTNDLYKPQVPATYVPEMDRVRDYPVALDPSFAVGADPLPAELISKDLYIMHWLVDVDDFYGFGKNAFVNTFQRGPSESVWKTIPHPSKETFGAGGKNGYLDLFIKDSSYVKQWRYTGAPDADARVIQAAYWAARWVREQGKDPAALLPLDKAARMGDSLRYALHDKYFKTDHHLLAWSQAWGGSLDRSNGWAWRSGASHVHFGYQNPLAAWALANDPLLKPPSPGAARDWSASVARQVEFYAWLQSAEGAIAGGATASLNGRYEPLPPGTPTFHGLAYVDHPVFRDPPSNEWFGWQAWSMGRLAQYARIADDPAARAVVDKWAAWARSVVKLHPDGSYSLPATLKWSGRPGAGLHVSTADETRDLGVAAALARALIAHGDPKSREVAGDLLDRIWTYYRDDRGVSVPEPRPDYKRFKEKVELPPDWRGALASGGDLKPG
ncbi:MAG: FecR domain-containing protein, partial [Planctomycetes bacterium]|nr:FecR domain-containing protein [Planctomycetota bacterium]